jgi:hypothetical protein
LTELLQNNRRHFEGSSLSIKTAIVPVDDSNIVGACRSGDEMDGSELANCTESKEDQDSQAGWF